MRQPGCVSRGQLARRECSRFLRSARMRTASTLATGSAGSVIFPDGVAVLGTGWVGGWVGGSGSFAPAARWDPHPDHVFLFPWSARPFSMAYFSQRSASKTRTWPRRLRLRSEPLLGGGLYDCAIAVCLCVRVVVSLCLCASVSDASYVLYLKTIANALHCDLPRNTCMRMLCSSWRCGRPCQNGRFSAMSMNLRPLARLAVGSALWLGNVSRAKARHEVSAFHATALLFSPWYPRSLFGSQC